MTVCYATSTVYVRRLVTRAALEMAAGFMIVGTVVMGGPVAVFGADLARIDTTLPSLRAIPYLELVSTAGYYCLISMLLNLFEVALPEGAELNWPELAR